MLLIQSNMADRSPLSLRRRRMAGWKDNDPHGIPGYAGVPLTGRGLSLTEPLPEDVAVRLVFLAGARVVTVSRMEGKVARTLDPDALGLCVGDDLPAPPPTPAPQEPAARTAPRAVSLVPARAGALGLDEAPSADFWERAGRRALDEVRALVGAGADAGGAAAETSVTEGSGAPEPTPPPAEEVVVSADDPEGGITTGLAAFVGGPPSVEERTRRLSELSVARLRSMLQEADPGRRVVGVPKSQIVDQLVALGHGGDI